MCLDEMRVTLVRFIKGCSRREQSENEGPLGFRVIGSVVGLESGD